MQRGRNFSCDEIRVATFSQGKLKKRMKLFLPTNRIKLQKPQS